MSTRTPGFTDGLRGALLGARLVGEHPRLWLWILVPLLVNAITFGGLVLAGWSVAHAMQTNLASASWGWFDGLREFLAPVVGVLLGLVSVLAALLVTLLASGIVNAPFYELLSEQVQRLVERRAEASRPWAVALADAWAAFLAALSLGLMQAAILSFLFLLSFTAVGAPLFALAGFFFTGFGLVDITLSRQRLAAPARRQWARRHARLLLGIGLPVSLVPPLAPFAVIGATLLCLRAQLAELAELRRSAAELERGA
jgi:uncharacterized protein involved in cysteine biosynthesis